MVAQELVEVDKQVLSTIFLQKSWSFDLSFSLKFGQIDHLKGGLRQKSGA